jgi:glycosyltransferase involved in cell wall biosynthesis
MSERPRRILHVDKFASRSGGGAPAYMLDLVRRQRARGHDVEFLATDGPTDLPTRYRSRFPARIELDPAPRHPRDQLRAVATMLWSRTAAASIAAVLDDFAPDVVHCHNLYHHLSPAVLAPIRTRGIRCVMTAHDYKLVCPTYRLVDGDGAHCTACVGGSVANVVRRRCQGGSVAKSSVLMLESGLHRRLGSYRGIDTLLCPSAFMAEQLRLGGYGDAVLHLPLGHDAAAIDAGTGCGAGVLYAGRLSREKGVHLLIDAMAQVSGDLTICGDGPERAELERLGAERLGERMRFLGHVSHAVVLDQMRAAAVVVVPSTWAENQPLVVLDAMACGVAIVAGNTPALAELVEGSGAGVCVNAADSGALSRAIASFVDDQAAAAAAGRRGRSYVLDHHDMDRHLDALDREYRLADCGVRR